MAYNKKYTHLFCDRYGRESSVSILKKDYIGVEYIVDASPSPIVITYEGSDTDKFDPIRASTANITLVGTKTFSLEELYTSDEREYQVEYRIGTKLEWRGYVIPNGFSQPWIDGTRYMSLMASDNLSTLKDYAFLNDDGSVIHGRMSHIDILLKCLNKLDIDIELQVLVNIKKQGSVGDERSLRLNTTDAHTFLATNVFREGIDLYYENPDNAFSCDVVVSTILSLYGAKLYQNDGVWRVKQINADYGVDISGQEFYRYSTLGDNLGKATYDSNVILPCESDENSMQLSGATIAMSDVYKSASVRYEYRYKQVGDNLPQIIKNPNFNGAYDNPPVWTPDDWEIIDQFPDFPGDTRRMRIARELLPLGDFPPSGDGGVGAGGVIKIWDSRRGNTLKSTPTEEPSLNEGDRAYIQFWAKSPKISDLGRYMPFTILIRVILKTNGQEYHLKNNQEPAWIPDPDAKGKITGSWVGHSVSDRALVPSYSVVPVPEIVDQQNPDPEWGHISILTDATPIDGVLSIEFIGTAYADDSPRLPYDNRTNAIVPAYDFGTPTLPQTNAWRIAPMRLFYHEFKIGSLKVGRLVGNGSSGRIYTAEQNKKFTKRPDVVNILTADVANVDTIGTIVHLGDVVDNWQDTRNPHGGFRPLGALGAMDIMRQYKEVWRVVEEDLIIDSIDFDTTIEFDARPNERFLIQRGSFDVKDCRLIGATLIQVSQIPIIAFNGEEYIEEDEAVSGNPSGGGGGGSSGGGGGGGQMQGLQSVTDIGNTTTNIIEVRGSRNEEVLSIPKEEPPVADIVAGEVYLHYGTVGVGGTMPPPILNLEDLLNVQEVIFDGKFLQKVGGEWRGVDAPSGGGGGGGDASQSWVMDNFAPISHTHANATISVSGFMSGADKVKLDSITAGANNYTHPAKTWVDKAALSNATVISNLTVDSLGHPTNWTTRSLTAGDLNAYTKSEGNTRYARLAFDNTFTAKNHFDVAISIPKIQPVSPVSGKVYLHYGSVGSGGSTPPSITNFEDLANVESVIANGSFIQKVGGVWKGVAIASPDLSGYATESWANNRFPLKAHTHTFASLTAKPTTLSGYGITDSFTRTELDGRYLKLIGGVMTGGISGTDIALTGHFSSATMSVQGSARFQFNTGYWYNDDAGNQRMFMGLGANSNGIIFQASENGQDFQFRDKDNNVTSRIGMQYGHARFYGSMRTPHAIASSALSIPIGSPASNSITAQSAEVYLYYGEVGSGGITPPSITNFEDLANVENTIANGSFIQKVGGVWKGVAIAAPDLSGYATESWANNRFPLKAHTHTIANITGLQSALDAKPNTDTKYTSSNGIVLTNFNFAPTYGTVVNTFAQGNDSRFHSHSNKAVIDGITAGLITNWNTAFGWGDFRDFGIGTTPYRVNDQQGFDDYRLTSFIRGAGTSTVAFVSGAGIALNIPYDNDRRVQLFMSTASDNVQFRRTINGVWEEARTLWHDGNLRSNTENDGRFARLEWNNDFTAINHFEHSLGIPKVSPTSPVSGKVYLHYGSVGSGGSTPPSITNFEDLANVESVIANGSFIQKVGGVWKGVAIASPDLSGYATESWSNNKFELKFTKNTAFNKKFGTGSTDVAKGNHIHVISNITGLQSALDAKPNTDTKYTSNNGIVLTNLNFAPTYGTAANTFAQGNDSRFHTHTNKSVLDGISTSLITNWNTAYAWGDFRDFGLGTIPIRADDDIELGANNPTMFLRAMNAASLDFETGAGVAINIPYDNARRVQLFINTARDSVQFRRTINGVWEEARTLWHDGNLRSNSENDGRFARLSFNNEFTARNHFEHSLGIPKVTPSNPESGKVYIHYGSVGSGGSTPPSITNFEDLANVENTIANGSFIQKVGGVWKGVAISSPDLSGYATESWSNNRFSRSNDSRFHAHSNKAVLDGITSLLVTRWNNSYGWGDFRDFGLGTTPTAVTEAGWDVYRETSFIKGTGYTTGAFADKGAGIGLNIPYDNDRRVQLYMSVYTDDLSFRRSMDGIWGDTVTLWHDGNLRSNTENDGRFAYKSHTHSISEVNGLQGQLDSKPNTDTKYTSSKGIKLTGLDFAPTYGTASNTIAQGNDNRFHAHSNKSVIDGITSGLITNWNTAHGWGDFRDFGLGETGVTLTPSNQYDMRGNSFIRVSSGANTDFGSFGAGIHMKMDNIRQAQLFCGLADDRLMFRQTTSGETGWEDVQTIWTDKILRSNSQNDDRYLKLTGGTLTGLITAPAIESTKSLSIPVGSPTQNGVAAKSGHVYIYYQQ